MNIEEIISHNPQWQDQYLPPSPYEYRRALHKKLRPYLDSRFALLLYGIRRVGKSVLARQVIDDLVKLHNIQDTKQICFLSFEQEDIYDLLPHSALHEALNAYCLNILNKPIAKITQQIIIFIDEIQNILNWQSIIKKYYDLNPHIKFVITGSASLFIHEGAESLVGRSMDFKVPPLSFKEFLDLSGNREKFPKSYRDGYFSPQSESESASDFPLQFEVTALQRKLFGDFLLIGGFPDTAILYKSGKSIREIQEFIRSAIINKVIHKDLKRYFNVKNTHHDMRLFEICSQSSSQFLKVSHIAQDVALSQQSVSKHLEIFENTCLLSRLEKYDSSLRRLIAGSRKIYIASPCIMYAVLHIHHIEDRAFLGLAAETYAYNQLSNVYEKLYVDNPHKQKEIDFYIPYDHLMIECKYSKAIDIRKFFYLMKRAKRRECKAAVLTQETWLHKNDIVGIPLIFV